MTRARNGHLVLRLSVPPPYVGPTEHVPGDPLCLGHCRKDPPLEIPYNGTKWKPPYDRAGCPSMLRHTSGNYCFAVMFRFMNPNSDFN